MTIGEHDDEFFEREIEAFDVTQGVQNVTAAQRIELTWEEQDEGAKLEQRIDQLAADPKAASVQAIVIGTWNTTGEDSSAEMIAALVRHAPRF